RPLSLDSTPLVGGDTTDSGFVVQNSPRGCKILSTQFEIVRYWNHIYNTLTQNASLICRAYQIKNRSDGKKAPVMPQLGEASKPSQLLTDKEIKQKQVGLERNTGAIIVGSGHPMAAKLLLPDHVIARLRCDLCRGYLSVPPISSHEDKVSCGRCDPGWQRNSAYEHLAQFVLFPCTYCAEKLAWSEVAAHEQKCKRDIILCPALYEKNYKLSKMPRSNLGEYHADCQARAIACPFDYCDAKYAARDVPGHFRKYHEEYIFDDSQVVARKNMKAEKVWNFNSDNQVCLLAYKQMPFLLFVHSDCQYDESTGDIVSYDYFFGVFTFCLNRCDVKYTASITLASDQDSTTHTMKNQDIKPFNPSLHSVNLLRIGLIRHRSFDFMTTRFRNLPRLPNLKLTYTVKILDGFDAAEKTDTETQTEH
ncbi:hypothetical protein NQ317_002118, partial [Molorchus minor]